MVIQEVKKQNFDHQFLFRCFLSLIEFRYYRSVFFSRQFRIIFSWLVLILIKIIDRVNLGLPILGTHFILSEGGIVTSADEVFLFSFCLGLVFFS